MKIERIWSMPNRWTFTIKPIRELLTEEIMPSELWCDPFVGKSEWATVTNDLNSDIKAVSHVDALAFLREQKSAAFDGVLYDPPYSHRQASECYKAFGLAAFSSTVTNNKYWADIKTEIARIVRSGGKIISFGWNTNGIGMSRGAVLKRVLIVPHGSGINDTLVTVEYMEMIDRA